MSLTDAQAQGALAFFTHKYSDRVSVYSIGSFSKEVCGGPHVSNTREIGPLAIYKQEAVGAGRRRLYARLK
jgi:alanyl-tRNA synthetase